MMSVRGRRIRRGNRRPPSLDSGISLVELLVSMMIIGILGVIVTSLYVSASRTVSQAQALSTNTREASNGMNEVARVIRAATANPVQGVALSEPALSEAKDEAVTIYAYINLASSAQQPVKIRFSLDASRRLIETQWASYVISPGYYGFNTVPSTTRVMATTVAPTSSGQPQIFSYVKADGSVLAGGTAGLGEADRRLIAAVNVTLRLQATTTNTKSAVTLQNTVGMPNLGLSRIG